MKLKKVTLKNFRGARGEPPLKLNLEKGYSALIYGDNGTGKSSFADAVEWLVTDKVKHLRGAEVERHGGLKNAFAEESEESYVELEFDDQYVLRKNLIQKKDKFSAKFANPESDEGLSDSLNSENLIIRNSELIQFILFTGGERLADISNIIGFQDVKITKDILSKASNSLNRTIKARNFEAQISNNKSKILEKLKATVNSKEQLYASIASQLKILEIEKNITGEDTLKDALQELKKGVNEEEITKRNNINVCEKGLEDGLTKLKSFMDDLSAFAEELKKLKSDKEKIASISIVKLLEEGKKILSVGDKDECPLCESNIDRESLLTLIKDRLKALRAAQEQIKNLTEEKRILQTTFVEANNILENALNALETLKLDQVDIEKLKADINYLKSTGQVMNIEILALDEKKLSVNNSNLKNIESAVQTLKKIGESGGQQEAEKRVELYSSITASCDAFDEIVNLEREKEAIESQKKTMDTVLSLFNEVRKNEMDQFLNDISSDVNDYYLYMNHAEKVDEIKLIPTLGSDGELAGISIELKFHGKPVSAPKKFLSESYINCLGLCIFLASVKLFNKNAIFFILDDVISSFDKPHRVRFGQLLEEKFSDYQIIALTHEQEWFEFMSNAVKGKSWKVTRAQWSLDEGAYLELPSGDIKVEIEKMLQKKQETGLGNLIRRYAEKCFKELSNNLEAQLSFKYNDTNENRMLGELFPAVVSRVNKKSGYLKDKPVVKRLESSSFITTKASHDSSVKENIDDLKVVYGDVNEFYNLFFCESCGRLVNSKFLNSPKKTISCKCGKKEFEWKTN